MKRKSVWFKPQEVDGEDEFAASYTRERFKDEIFLCTTGLYQTARQLLHIDLPEDIKKLRFVIEETPKGEYTWFDFWDFTPVCLDVYAEHMGLFSDINRRHEDDSPRFNLWLEYII
jgi:hypothetical protein